MRVFPAFTAAAVYFLVSIAQFNSIEAAFCNGEPDDGERVNEQPIFDGELRFVRSVKNAMLFEAGPESAPFPVLHLWGTPYEMGVAQGTIMKKELRNFVTSLYSYLLTELTPDGDMFPDWAKELIIAKGVNAALDWTAEVTAPFTSQSYYDEVQGMADASGLSYDTIYRINMYPELTKASCSFFGAWGTAVGKDGYTYQLRSLDFDTSPPFADNPQVTVYHPTDGHAFVSVGFPGQVGVLTGMSDQRMAISEIGVSYPDDSFGQGTPNTGPEKVRGEPWMYVLRDTLERTDNLQDGLSNIENSNRTCNLVIGLGDGEEQMVNGIEYSGYVAVPYDDETLLPVNETWHWKIDDVVYNGMDWLCPGYTQKLAEQLTKYHGQITEETVVRNILPTVQSGDLHIAVYDLTDNNMHLSFCRKSTADESEPHYAYERQFTRLHMTEIFAQQPPADEV